MADIFLSYAREDRERAQRLAKALEGEGWSVFWDLTIPAGLTWDSYIGGELEKARCVVVAWSKAAVESDWVREEAREGRARKILVPVRFERVQPPFGFGGIQAVELSAWDGNPVDSGVRLLVEGLERILGPRPSRVEGVKRQRDAEARARQEEQEREYRRGEEQERRAEKERRQRIRSKPIWGVMRAFLQILLNGMGLLLAAYIVPGVEYSGRNLRYLLLVGLIIGLINLPVKPVVKRLSQPAPLLTLGLFYLVINHALFVLAGWSVGGLIVAGYLSSVLGGLVLAALNWLVEALPGND